MAISSKRTPDETLLREVFPLGATRDPKGVLTLGGVRVDRLAAEFGTPLYVYDEPTVRAQCRAYRQALAAAYPNSLVLYAGKAYVDPTFVGVIAAEGLGLDAVSSGEMLLAEAAAMPMDRIVLHGNNKAAAEIELALKLNVGRIVIDSLDELALVDELARRADRRPSVLLRVTPGVEAHTHHYIRTGAVDSKFGLGLESGAAAEAVARAMATDALDLAGLHAHIGSQIFDTEPYEDTMDIVLDFAELMRRRHGFKLRDLSPGGGAGARYTLADDPPAAVDLIDAIVRPVLSRNLTPRPRILVEPGRSIAARAGVALYAVGAIKRIPEVRTYASVDGGMADNLRPALYGAQYSVVLATRGADGPVERVTVAGRYCESGDVLLRDVELPRLQRGDLLAVPASGAYHMSMASNYNLVGRPAVVMVGEGRTRLTRRRERDEDLLSIFP